MTDGTKVTQFLPLMSFVWALNPVHLPWALLGTEFALGTSETFLYSTLVPPPRVPLQPFQFSVILVSSEDKVSDSIMCDIFSVYLNFVGRDSSVGIPTRYGLDFPRIESRCGRDFCTHPDRYLGPPGRLYNLYRVSLPGLNRPRRSLKQPHLTPRLKKE
jgi:hypothetical protein